MHGLAHVSVIERVRGSRARPVRTAGASDRADGVYPVATMQTSETMSASLGRTWPVVAASDGPGE
jgi:hypothetical protein